jgi:hypothetical protein
LDPNQAAWAKLSIDSLASCAIKQQYHIMVLKGMGAAELEVQRAQEDEVERERTMSRTASQVKMLDILDHPDRSESSGSDEEDPHWGFSDDDSGGEEPIASVNPMAGTHDEEEYKRRRSTAHEHEAVRKKSVQSVAMASQRRKNSAPSAGGSNDELAAALSRPQHKSSDSATMSAGPLLHRQQARDKQGAKGSSSSSSKGSSSKKGKSAHGVIKTRRKRSGPTTNTSSAPVALNSEAMSGGGAGRSVAKSPAKPVEWKKPQRRGSTAAERMKQYNESVDRAIFGLAPPKEYAARTPPSAEVAAAMAAMEEREIQRQTDRDVQAKGKKGVAKPSKSKQATQARKGSKGSKGSKESKQLREEHDALLRRVKQMEEKQVADAYNIKLEHDRHGRALSAMEYSKEREEKKAKKQGRVQRAETRALRHEVEQSRQQKEEQAQEQEQRELRLRQQEQEKQKETAELGALRELLLAGVLVGKFNGRGKKQARKLFCDPSFHQLHWQEAGKETPDYGRSRKGTVTGIKLSDILEVLDGAQTKVLKSSAKKATDGYHFLSFVTAERTLDLAIEGNDLHRQLLSGFKLLLKTMRAGHRVKAAVRLSLAGNVV